MPLNTDSVPFNEHVTVTPVPVMLHLQTVRTNLVGGHPKRSHSSNDSAVVVVFCSKPVNMSGKDLNAA